MGEIYRRCSRVRIWLGCDSTRCSLEQRFAGSDNVSETSLSESNPFQLVQSLARNQHISDWPGFKSKEGSLTFQDTKDFKSFWSGFLKIAESAWWTRMWTVQEVILPKAGVMTYDTWSISLEDITQCGTNYFDHVWNCCEHVVPSLPPGLPVPLDAFCTAFLTLNRDRKLADDEYFDIQEQHLIYGQRQCHNHRDKIYGLLALIGDITDLDLWLTPDYSKTEEEVFYHATWAMLYRDHRSLKCLTGAQYGAKAGKWASWVRDFGTPLTRSDADTGSNRLMIYDLFNASLGRKASFERYVAWPPCADEKPYQIGLRVTGRCVGKVASVSAASLDAGSRRSVLSDWIADSKIDLGPRVAEECYPDTTKKLWRTLLGGVKSAGTDNTEYSDWQVFDDKAMSWIEPFLAWTHGKVEMGLPFALDRTLIIAVDGRCYFQTQDGGQGLCYPRTEPEDEVWVVDGSKVPFILRRVHLDEEASAGLRPSDAYGSGVDGEYGVRDEYNDDDCCRVYYELIRDCYLDGYMHGEVGESATRHIVWV
jgi:hypothetical protein